MKKKQRVRDQISVNFTVDGGRIYEHMSDAVRGFDPEILAEKLLDRGIEVSDDLAKALGEIIEDLELVEWSELRDYFADDYDLDVDLGSWDIEAILDKLPKCEGLVRDNIQGLLNCLEGEVPEIHEARLSFIEGHIDDAGGEVLRACFKGWNPSPTDTWMFRRMVADAGFESLLKEEN